MSGLQRLSLHSAAQSETPSVCLPSGPAAARDDGTVTGNEIVDRAEAGPSRWRLALMCISPVTHVKKRLQQLAGSQMTKTAQGKALMPHVRDLDSGPVTMLKSKAGAIGVDF